MPKWRKLVVVLLASAAATAFTASPALGGKLHPCNAGGGNGFESTVTSDCDPGNSGGNNNGGG